MEKFVAVVFDTEEEAVNGAEAMRELHRNGELAVYAAAVISKDTDGKVELRKGTDEGPIGTAFGLLVGGMIGVLAGPAAVASGAAVAGSAAAAQAAAGGMAFGGMTGGLFGAYRDLWVAGVDATLLDNVATELLPGKSCIVASVDEVWTTPLDLKMKEAGGAVFRQLRIDAEDEQIAADLDAMDRELDALDAELEQASDGTKAAIKEKADATKARMKATGKKISARMDEMDAEFNARLDAIDEQIEKASDRTRERFEKRKAEIKANHEARKTKLHDAISVADAVTT